MLRPEFPPQAGYFRSQTGYIRCGPELPPPRPEIPLQFNTTSSIPFFVCSLWPLLDMSAYPHATSCSLSFCCAGGSSRPARKKACAGRGSRPLRLDRDDSGSSSGGQVEPPKRSRASCGKEPYKNVLELNQADFRAWRSSFNYDEPQDTNIDNCFWSAQMEKLHRDLYS